jgi:chromosomal replication initiation ATPase DnaA
MDIAALARQVCQKYNISLGELCSGSRRRVVVEARGLVSWIAVRELGYSGADVARCLGVTNSCVTRFVASVQSLMLMILSGIYECSARTLLTT